MTKFRKASVLCGNCHQAFPFEFYDTVDAVQDPQLLEAIATYQLFKSECPHCQEEQMVTYPTSIIDGDEKVVINYVTDEDMLIEAIEKYEEFLENEEEMVRLMGIDQYQVRFITEFDVFVEKALILSRGYDDRYIELMKIALLTSVDERESLAIDNILLVENDFGDLEFAVFSNGEMDGSFEFSESIYEWAMTTFPVDAYEPSYFIDSQWAFEIINELG